MGCFWSKDDDGINRCVECGRRAVNNLVILDQTCEICISVAKRRQHRVLFGRQELQSAVPFRPSFGEYRCSCGRCWSSRLSWANRYQICKRCRSEVYPFKQRALLPSDMTSNEKGQEHPKEMCQMCQQLGKYCGSYRQGVGQKSRTGGMQTRKRF